MTGNQLSSTHLNLHIAEENGSTRYHISDGSSEAVFVKYKKGLYCRGSQTAKQAVNRCGPVLQTMGMNPSAVAVMTALAENQNNLDTVIIHDEQSLSFGMLLWNLGAGGNPSQLAALLARVKDNDPHLFNAYFGQYGLDVHPVHSLAGYLCLNSEILKLPGQKDRLRSLEWAFRFWKSAQEPLLQAFQIRHAISRLDTFYQSRRCAPGGHLIAELITSQYGVAQVMDHHILRPGHLEPCLSAALKYSKLPPPQYWSGVEELLLIETYLAIRAEYGVFPMPNAEERAAVIKNYLDKGILSSERNSFVTGNSPAAENQSGA